MVDLFVAIFLGWAIVVYGYVLVLFISNSIRMFLFSCAEDFKNYDREREAAMDRDVEAGPEEQTEMSKIGLTEEEFWERYGNLRKTENQ